MGDLTVRPPAEAMKSVLASDGNVDLYIVLSDLGRILDQELMNTFPGVPMVIVGSRDLSSLDQPIVRAEKILVQPMFRGQQWGRLRLSWQNTAKGWFNLGGAQRFNDLWSRIESNRDLAMKRPEDAERSSELKSQSDAAQEIMEQGPPAVGMKKQVFDYELIDLGAKYMKTNELTKRMKQVNAL
jgi:hypothetical protein